MAYDGLVISGGAARGGAFLGALHRLRELGLLDSVRVVAGTSIGSLLAVLVAQDADMLQTLRTIASKPFDLQPDLVTIEPPFGIDSGAELLDFIRGLVGQESFSELHERTRKDVVICATSLIQRRPVYFSHTTHPDMEVAWAVRLSCTLPLLFAYGTHREEAFVDGGLTDNFPVQAAVDRGSKSILGIRLRTPDPQQLPGELTQYVVALMSCVAWQSVLQDDACSRVVQLEADNHPVFDFCMTRQALLDLFRIGYRAV